MDRDEVRECVRYSSVYLLGLERLVGWRADFEPFDDFIHSPADSPCLQKRKEKGYRTIIREVTILRFLFGKTITYLVNIDCFVVQLWKQR